MKYVAFLRGINVGGNSMIKMADLRRLFEELGFTNVKTILASGNVLFDSEKSASSLVNDIEEALEKHLNKPASVIIRTRGQIEELIKRDPFKKITVTPETRLYITFQKEKSARSLKIPYKSPHGEFQIIDVTNTEVCSVVVINPKFKTTESMMILEKEYGKDVTTRNWNTLLRIVKT